MGVIHDSQGRGIDELNPLNVKIAGADASGGAVNTTTNDILPVDVQSRLSQTIQTQNGVTVGPTTNTTGVAIDCDGFDKIAVTFKNDASTNAKVQIKWSHDGTNIVGENEIIPASTLYGRGGELSVMARYAHVQLFNSDTAPHVMSAWAYLKV